MSDSEKTTQETETTVEHPDGTEVSHTETETQEKTSSDDDSDDGA